jgi:acetylornithine deacetylase
VARGPSDPQTVLKQLKELIETPSVSSTDPAWDQGNIALIERLAQFAEQAGFDVQIQPLQGSSNKANLIATKGSGTQGLVLAGHSDTVPFDAGRWDSDPLKLCERDKRLYGLGTSDMKGFFPLALAAAANYRATDLKAPITLIATADEESTMAGARALLKSQIHQARAVIIGEPTSLRPIRMHKGMLMSRIVVNGRSGHSSNPSLGNNALDGLHSVMTELMALRRSWQGLYNHPAFEVSYPTLNFGHVHAGDSPNRICAHSELHFDLRLIPGLALEDITAAFQDICKRIANETQLDIRWEPLMDPVPPFEEGAESALIRLAESLSSSEATSALFATEAGFFKALGAEALVMGPGSIDLAHQPNEYLRLDELQPAITFMERAIHHYCT